MTSTLNSDTKPEEIGAVTPQTTSAFRNVTPRFRATKVVADNVTSERLRRESRQRRAEEERREADERRKRAEKAARSKNTDADAMAAGVLPFSIMATAYRRQRVLDSIGEGDISVILSMRERWEKEQEEMKRRAELQRLIQERNKVSDFTHSNLDRNRRADAITEMLERRRVETARQEELADRLSGDASATSTDSVSDSDGATSRRSRATSRGSRAEVEFLPTPVMVGGDDGGPVVVMPPELAMLENLTSTGHHPLELAPGAGTFEPTQRGPVGMTGRMAQPPPGAVRRPAPRSVRWGDGAGAGGGACGAPSPPGTGATPGPARGPTNLNTRMVTTPAPIKVPLRWGRPPSATLAPKREHLRHLARSLATRDALAATPPPAPPGTRPGTAAVRRPATAAMGEVWRQSHLPTDPFPASPRPGTFQSPRPRGFVPGASGPPFPRPAPAGGNEAAPEPRSPSVASPRASQRCSRRISTHRDSLRDSLRGSQRGSQRWSQREGRQSLRPTTTGAVGSPAAQAPGMSRQAGGKPGRPLSRSEVVRQNMQLFKSRPTHCDLTIRLQTQQMVTSDAEAFREAKSRAGSVFRRSGRL